MLTEIWCGSGGGEVQLADGVTALASPIRMPGRSASQVAAYLGADAPVYLDGLSKSRGVSFTITRQHGGYLAAASFRASHHDALPNVADLRLRWTAGGIYVEAVFAGAAWEEADVELNGVSTTTQYTLSAGRAAVTTGP